MNTRATTALLAWVALASAGCGYTVVTTPATTAVQLRSTPAILSPPPPGAHEIGTLLERKGSYGTVEGCEAQLAKDAAARFRATHVRIVEEGDGINALGWNAPYCGGVAYGP
jgi:hypothetical protein